MKFMLFFRFFCYDFCRFTNPKLQLNLKYFTYTHGALLRNMLLIFAYKLIFTVGWSPMDYLLDFYSGLNSHELSSFILHLFSFIRHHAELALIHGLPAGAEGADANLGLGRKKDRRRFSPRGVARSSSRAAAGSRSITRWWSRHSLHLW